jgi:hypothetical protein
MFTQKLRVMFVIGIMFIAFTACGGDSSQENVPPVSIYPQTLKGYTGCKWGDLECNPPAKSVQDQIANLRQFGDFLGFFLNGSPDLSSYHHLQGIQRFSTKSLESGSYTDFLVLTRSNEHYSSDDSTPDIYIVAMDSRNALGTEGERYRSNRLCPGYTDIYAAPPDMCPIPDPLHMERDKVVQWKNVLTQYNHAGGFQLIGKYAVIPFENSDKDTDKDGKFGIVDISKGKTDPDSLEAKYFQSVVGQENAGTTAIGKLEDGRYLLIVGTKNCNHLFFYISEGTTLETNPDFQLVTDFDFSDQDGHRAYQNTTLVIEQKTGELYLICTYDSVAGYGGGADWVHLWGLTIKEDVDDNDNYSYTVKVDKEEEERQLYSRWGINSRQCNLNAAAGVYVDPHGNIIIYATEHDNNGPEGSVKMMEFRGALPKYNPPVDKDKNKSWVEIYDDKDFKGRSLMIDYRDRNLRFYSNFDDVDSFGDKASSVRCNLYPGVEGTMYKDHGYAGNTCTLSGQSYCSDLSDGHFCGIGNDNVSSFEF